MIRNKIASKVLPVPNDQFDVDNNGVVSGTVRVKQGGHFQVADDVGSNFSGTIHIYCGDEEMTDKVIEATESTATHSTATFPTVSPGKPGKFKIKGDALCGLYDVRTRRPSQLLTTSTNNCPTTESGTLRVGSPPTDDDDDDRHGRKGDSAHDTEHVSPTRRR